MSTEILRELVYEAMKVVTSADKAYSYLRARGYDFTRRSIRETWKQVGEETYWSRVIETWGTDKYVPKAWRVESPRLKMADYELVYEVTFYKPEENEFVTRRIARMTNKLETFDEGWEAITDARQKYERLTDAVIVEWRPFAFIEKKV